ncbi:unnamed protein product [Oppiella nova]|uniref:Lysozyme n=1 Tax=Oppiella nova TaxID=334625 RepID=A0A7R9QS21_9ACAR|nr:unnamed protein product [Oppiella nova]CAG2171839.1 unnamed protein product [Oppiella nova]
MAKILIVVLALVAVAAAQQRKIGSAGLSLLKQSEGFVPNFYKDQIGLQTIGYGHACQWQGCAGINPPITEAQGTQILMKDLVQFEDCVNTAAPGLTQNQYDACVDFAFNMGCGAFQGSDILRNIKAKNYQAAANSFAEYNVAGGQVIEGLTVRRQNEKNLFLKK